MTSLVLRHHFRSVPRSGTSTSGAILPPGHCHCAGGHKLSRCHHRQVAHVHHHVQASHQRNGNDNSPGKIYLEKKGDIIFFRSWSICLLFNAYDLLPSGRWFKVLFLRTNRARRSFVLTSILLQKEEKKRKTKDYLEAYS